MAPPPAKLHLADQFENWPASPHNARLRVEHRAIVPSDKQPRRSKVLIYGAGLYRDEAVDLLDDPSWEVWALNLIPPFDSHRRLRADVWFDLHQRIAQTDDDMRWIAACPFPIYVPPDLEDASPNAVHFPLEEIERTLGAYWSCTFGYQMALALHSGGVTDVALFGVELAYGTQRERTVEWACVAYWLGRLEQAGLSIHLPHNSSLGRHVARYGFEYQNEIELVNQYIDRVSVLGEDKRRQLRDGVDVGG
jgi:hypothetical protein